MKTKRSGSFSAFGLLAVSVILIGSMGVAGLSMSDMARATKEQRAVQAFEASQAGLEHGIATAYASLGDNRGLFIQSSYDFTSELGALASGGTIETMVTPGPDGTYAWITSIATVNGVTRSVRTLISEHNVGIWNNAIFAGSGASGQAINGNVSIAGSVHLLGDGEPFTDTNGNAVWDAAESFTDKNKNGIWDPGESFIDANGDGAYTRAEPYNDTNANGAYDPPMTVTSLDTSFSGSGCILNNYSQMPLTLQGTVPPAPTFNGVQTLSAEIRDKHGRIGLSGAAIIGQGGVVNGGTLKGPVDGVYVTDGWGGNKGASAVTSDNGTSNPYDVGGLGIEFPIISGIGAQQYLASDGSVWTTQEQYLDSRSLVCPVTTITKSTAAFSYGPDAYGNSIRFTPANGSNPCRLTLSGVIKFNGDLHVGSKDSIYYAGNGTLYAPNIYVDGDFLPAAGLTFPTQARAGMIAKQNLRLASGNGSSQLSMVGAFYAQGTISSQKQNQIAGTFVANYFDMGTNVPNIYQVPSLPANMPPAMPGDKGYFTLRVRGWRERTPAQINATRREPPVALQDLGPLPHGT